MDDTGVTQVLEREAEAADGNDGGTVGGTGTAAGAGGRFPKWAFAVVVALVLLALAVAGVLLASRQKDDVRAAADVVVPDIRGMTLDRAGEEVLALGLAPGTINYAVVEASVAPSGTVLTQEPLPGTKAKVGSTLNIVLAQGPTVVAAADAVTPPEQQAATGSSASSGSDSTGAGTPPPPAESKPIVPDLPPAETIDPSRLQPRIIDPGLFKLVTTEYKTVLQHTGYNGDWQSPAIVLGSKPKRIWFTADGPYAMPAAVWAWGPNDSDWKLKTIWASYPGAFESEDGKGGTLVEAFDVGAGTYTILVRVNPEVTWWSVRIEEQK